MKQKLKKEESDYQKEERRGNSSMKQKLMKKEGKKLLNETKIEEKVKRNF